MVNRISDRWIAWALMLYVLGLAAWLAINAVRVTLEDGFYYLKIAQNIANGAGSTFDGINLTNGYHPLWLLSLIPLFWLDSTPGPALSMAILLQAVFLAASTTLLYYTARLRTGQEAASLAALLWVMLTYQVSFGGLEFSLHALMLLASAYTYLRWFATDTAPPPGLYFGLGLLLSLTILARLDTLMLAAIIGLTLAGPELKQGLTPAGVRRLLAVGTPILLTCLLYAGTNLLLFNQPFPVSGVIKRTWSTYLLSQDVLYVEQGWLVAKLNQLLWPLRHLNRLFPISLAVGTYGAAGLWIFSTRSAPHLPRFQWLKQMIRAWTPFILFSLLNFFSYGLLYHQHLSVPAWYYVVQPWLTSLLVAAFIDKLIRRPASCDVETSGKVPIFRRRLGIIAFMVIWAAVPYYTLWSLEQWRVADKDGTIPQPLYEGALWVKVNLPPDAVIGAWNAGAISYLSGRQVINLDGLVNSWTYYQQDGADLCRYWQMVELTHLVDIFDRRPGYIEAIAPAPTYPYYAHCADQLELLWSDDRNPQRWWRLEAYQLRSFDD